MNRIFILFMLLLPACSSTLVDRPTPTPDKCRPEAMAEYYDTINDVARRFEDAVELAGSTPRMNLTPVISDLQAIRRDAEDLKVPGCASFAKEALIDYMNAEIDGFMKFMASEDDSVVSSQMKVANNKLDIYIDEILRLQGLATPSP